VVFVVLDEPSPSGGLFVVVVESERVSELFVAAGGVFTMTGGLEAGAFSWTTVV